MGGAVTSQEARQGLFVYVDALTGGLQLELHELLNDNEESRLARPFGKNPCPMVSARIMFCKHVKKVLDFLGSVGPFGCKPTAGCEEESVLTLLSSVTLFLWPHWHKHNLPWTCAIV